MKTFLLTPLLLGLACARVEIVPYHKALGMAVKEAHEPLPPAAPEHPSPGHNCPDDKWDEHAENMPPNMVPREDTGLSTMQPDGFKKGLGTLLFPFKERLIFLVASKVSSVVVKSVISKLVEKTIINQPSKATEDFIITTLQSLTIVILTMALIADHKKGGDPHKHYQSVVLGADDGIGKRVERRSLLLDEPIHTTTWDITDDEAHANGNIHDDRTIMSDDLRSHMISRGHSNVTFLHTRSGPTAVPALVYHDDEGVMHYHLQPLQQDLPEKKKPKKPKHIVAHFEKHYPFFNAGGAGFKISAQVPIDVRSIAATQDDAKDIAKRIATDFVKNRGADSAVGYTEQFKSGWVGHKMCFMPEAVAFTLNNQLDECFNPANEVC